MSHRLRCSFDTNVLIDLAAGGLLADLPHLPLDCFVVDAVMAELAEADRERLRAHGVIERELEPRWVAWASDRAGVERQLAVADTFALALALQDGAILVTGDARLRRVAESLLEVHGTLWVVDQLVECSIVSPGVAARALELMVAAGSRLPQREVAARVRRWRAADDE